MSVKSLIRFTGISLGFIAAGIYLFANCSSHPSEEKETAASVKIGAAGKEDSLEKTVAINHTALFLAGMSESGRSSTFELAGTPAWKTYAKESDSNWARFFRRKLDPVRNWEKKEVPATFDTVKTLFYPFSGPDFIFANAFFPNVDRYILFGLEPPGRVPDPATWKEENLKSSLALINKSIDDITSIGFFRTNDMKVDLKSSSIEGVTPILILFLVRSGQTITDISAGKLDPSGEFRASAGKSETVENSGNGAAVEIRFRDQNSGRPRSLIYFSADVSDEGLAKNENCRNFLQKVPSNCITMIKSASYLMHLSGFSSVRKTILAKSVFILQDDTGIPYRFLSNKNWEIRLFGTYTKTINLFKNKYQEDLKEAYEKYEKPEKVPFMIGYNVKFHETNLLMAIRKNNAR
jgi:hypothetical protein